MLSTSIANQVATAIVHHQTAIMGPLALEQAKQVSGIIVSASDIQVQNDPLSTITALVQKYEGLFGQTSVEVCKDAVKELGSVVSSKDLPAILQ